MDIKKAQSGIEFTVLFAFVMLVFIVFFAIAQQKISEVSKQQQESGLKDVATTVLNEISLARSSPDGYYREFSLPYETNDYEYTIEISGGELILQSQDITITHLEFLEPDVKGDLISLGKNSISKSGGVITIAEVLIPLDPETPPPESS